MMESDENKLGGYYISVCSMEEGGLKDVAKGFEQREV